MNRTRKEMTAWLIALHAESKKQYAESKEKYKQHNWLGKVLLFTEYMNERTAMFYAINGMELALMRMNAYWKFYYEHGETMTGRVGYPFPDNFEVSITTHGVFINTTHRTQYNIQAMMEKYQ